MIPSLAKRSVCAVTVHIIYVHLYTQKTNLWRNKKVFSYSVQSRFVALNNIFYLYTYYSELFKFTRVCVIYSQFVTRATPRCSCICIIYLRYVLSTFGSPPKKTSRLFPRNYSNNIPALLIFRNLPNARMEKSLFHFETHSPLRSITTSTLNG